MSQSYGNDGISGRNREWEKIVEILSELENRLGEERKIPFGGKLDKCSFEDEARSFKSSNFSTVFVIMTSFIFEWLKATLLVHTFMNLAGCFWLPGRDA